MSKLRRILTNKKAKNQDRHIRLHIGCGNKSLPGWINIDMKPYPGVDVVADVTQGLQFSDVEAVFAEHFLEHLPIDAALSFLLDVHRVLAFGGWLRLSTPNLDWVWATHYQLQGDSAKKRIQAMRLNRAFHGWGHRFLWNREMLGEALMACGYAGIRWCRYGQSDIPIFQGIEHHETYEDTNDLLHVIIVEAQKGESQANRLDDFRRLIQIEFLDHLSE